MGLRMGPQIQPFVRVLRNEYLELTERRRCGDSIDVHPTGTPLSPRIPFPRQTFCGETKRIKNNENLCKR